MNYVEYGKENSDVIILLHGGGLSWWNYKEVAERLQTDYHALHMEYQYYSEDTGYAKSKTSRDVYGEIYIYFYGE